MDEFELRRIIYDYIKEICHFSQMQVFATSSYQKNYFQLQIDELISGLTNFFLLYNRNPASPNQFYAMNQTAQENDQEKDNQNSNTGNLREITPEELAQHDGSDGKGAYVAVNGIVYDVTNAIRWAGGTHFGLYAGKNLSSEFMGCHNGMVEILQILPIAGSLKK